MREWIAAVVGNLASASAKFGSAVRVREAAAAETWNNWN